MRQPGGETAIGLPMESAEDKEDRSYPRESGLDTLRLVDEIAQFCQDAVIQFDAQEPRSEWRVDAVFETLEDLKRQIRLLPKHPQQSHDVSRAFVLAGQPACWGDCQHERNRSF